MPDYLFIMPDYLFIIRENSDKHNVIISAIDIFKSNKLLVQFEFSQTYDLINEILSNKYIILRSLSSDYKRYIYKDIKINIL